MKNQRRIVLKGAHNFRDVGGYPTQDGKIIKWGMLYRSDNLSKLTPKDIQIVDNLNIRQVIDFRTPDEIQSKPNRFFDVQPICTTNLPTYGVSKSAAELKKGIFSNTFNGYSLKEDIKAAYRYTFRDYRSEWTQLFDCLQDASKYPVLLLCNAGKDRTGVAVATLLSALGVPRSVIIKDYMLSQTFLNKMNQKIAMKVRLFSFFRADMKSLKALLDTRLSYIEQTFQYIDDTFGSIDACLEYMGVTIEKKQYLRQIFCQ